MSSTSEEFEALKRQREEDIEADARRALEEAKRRPAPLDLTELDRRIATAHENQIPRDTEAAREAWARRFAETGQ